MNDVTVIRFERQQAVEDVFQCKLVSSAQDKNLPSVFDVSVLGGPFEPDPVREMGSRIFQQLSKNDSIKQAIGDALKAKKNTVWPIYIDTESLTAETICWEALFDGATQFLALDQRWPIARRAQADPPIVQMAFFSPPLRILAVISAEKYPGDEEWAGLYKAAQKAIALGLSVEIKVVTGDAALFNTVRGAQGNPGVSAPEAVPDSEDELDLIIGAFKPQIVHFFCHGLIEPSPWLVVRTGTKGKPLKVAVESLKSLRNVWLVVMNSCDSSVPAGDAPSMAYQMVTKLAVPFVLGTLAPIDLLDAYRFTESFYGRLLFNFAGTIKTVQVQQAITIEWMEALHAARKAIDLKYEGTSATNNQWTRPVLYERAQALNIVSAFAAEPKPAEVRPAEPKPAEPKPAEVKPAEPKPPEPELGAPKLPEPKPPEPKPRPPIVPPAATDVDQMVIRTTMVEELLRSLPPNTPEAVKKALVDSILSPKKVGAP